MKILICGAGQVGFHIAAYLSREGNDVTVVDNHRQLVSRINESLDVNVILGHASNPDILNAAGASAVDMMIAVTQSDEVNMMACQIGHSLFGIPKKIARIREQAYLKPEWSNLFTRAHMPIDVVISPEVLIAHDIYQRLSIPGTTFVKALAEGAAHIIGVVCTTECPILHTPLRQVYGLFGDLSFRIVSIMRQGQALVPDDMEQMREGDEVFFIVDTQHIKRVMTVFGHEEKTARKIVIAGGGNIGLGLTRLLKKKTKGLQIKIIDRNPERTSYLSETLENVVILNGSALEKHILEEANIRTAEAFVAVTNDDESNILASLLGKQYGCRRTITLVSNDAYSPLVGPLGVDAMVSPRSIMVSTIMQHVRRGRIKGIYALRDGFAEIIEAEVSPVSAMVNKPVSQLNSEHEIVVAGLVRDGVFLIPESQTVIRAKDVAIILAVRNQVRHIEKMFSAHVDIF